MLSDVPFNWRKAKIGSGCNPPPVRELAITPPISHQRSVYLPWGVWGEDVIKIRDWIRDNTNDTTKIYGRYEWTRKKFETTRSLIGLTFEFTNDVDQLHFLLYWG